MHGAVALAEEIYLVKCMIAGDGDPVNVGATGPPEAEGDEGNRMEVIRDVVGVLCLAMKYTSPI